MVCSGARLIVDDDRLSELHSELLRDCACHDIDAAAGGKRHNESNRPHGVLSGGRESQHEQGR
jgi:hypothetical protein